MNAHTEHNATLAQVIRDDADCLCSGACRNGRDVCTCGLCMPVPTGWAASASTEIGADDDYYSLPTRPGELTGWELFAGLLLLVVCVVAYLAWPEGFVGWGVR